MPLLHSKVAASLSVLDHCHEGADLSIDLALQLQRAELNLANVRDASSAETLAAAAASRAARAATAAKTALAIAAINAA